MNAIQNAKKYIVPGIFVLFCLVMVLSVSGCQQNSRYFTVVGHVTPYAIVSLLPDDNILIDGKPPQVFNPTTHQTTTLGLDEGEKIRNKILFDGAYLHGKSKCDFIFGPTGLCLDKAEKVDDYQNMDFKPLNVSNQSDKYLSDKFKIYKTNLISRRGGTYVEIPGQKILVIGGTIANESGTDELPALQVELFDPIAMKSTVIGNLREGRGWNRDPLVLDRNRVLFYGSDITIYDLRSKKLKTVASYDGCYKDRYGKICIQGLANPALLPDGNVLFSGGGDDVLLFDPKTNLLKKIDTLPGRRNSNGVYIPSTQKFYLMGGWWHTSMFGPMTIYDSILEFDYKKFKKDNI